MLYPHKVRIFRFRYDSDEYGGEKPAELPVQTGTACGIQSMGQKEIVRYFSREMAVDTKVYFPVEPPLVVGDYIYVESNDAGTSYVGQYFEFKSIDDASAGHGVVWKAMFLRVTNPTLPRRDEDFDVTPAAEDGYPLQYPYPLQ